MKIEDIVRRLMIEYPREKVFLQEESIGYWD